MHGRVEALLPTTRDAVTAPSAGATLDLALRVLRRGSPTTTENEEADVSQRVLLHVGTPKTGTSYLQDVLFRNRRVLAERGSSIPPSASTSTSWRRST